MRTLLIAILFAVDGQYNVLNVSESPLLEQAILLVLFTAGVWLAINQDIRELYPRELSSKEKENE